MRLSFQILLLPIIISGCATHQFDKEPPKTLHTAYYQPWVSGVRGGGSGLNIVLGFHNKEIIPDSAYFRNQVSSFKVEGTLYVARFSTSANQQTDLVLHKDHKKEYGNTFPPKNKPSDQLRADDALISYQIEGKSRYFMIRNIEKKSSIPIPKTRQEQ